MLNIVLNVFKVNHNCTRTTSNYVFLLSLIRTLNKFNILFIGKASTIQYQLSDSKTLYDA